MSEPSAGLPPPAGQPSGIEQPAGQPPVSQPNPATPAPANPQAAPPPPAPQSAQEVEALRKELELVKKSAAHFQSNYDRAQQQIRAMAGVQQPPPDPYAAKIKAFVDKGYGEEDARMLVDLVRSETEPLRQRNQQMEAQLQGTTQAQNAYQQFAEANPELAADPKIAQATWQALQGAAMQGQPGFVNAEYARLVAAQEWALANEPWKQQANQPPPAPLPGYVPKGFPMSFSGPAGAFPPPNQQQQQRDPAEDEMARRMAQRAGLDPTKV